jgi:hypothetical protein
MFMDVLQRPGADARTLFEHVCSRCDAMTLRRLNLVPSGK